jgi:hypothetical protein
MAEDVGLTMFAYSGRTKRRKIKALVEQHIHCVAVESNIIKANVESEFAPSVLSRRVPG